MYNKKQNNMKCPSCGKEIAEDSKFCEYCGVQVKKNSKPLLITLFVVIGLVALGGFGYYQYDKAKQQEYARTHSRSNRHDRVDLGLSVKWATCNVGASKPEDYGNYYAWGETSTKSSYIESKSKTYGKNIGDIKGNSNYDAARANWGGNWRLPTKAERQELIDKCNWTWITQNGKNGYKVTGPNGNSIFLPAAGFRYGSSLYFAGSCGYYWSSSPYESGSDYAYYLGFNSSFQGMNDDFRYIGQSVRPVIE